VFGVPPLWGPVPLVLVALADSDHYHVTVIPGAGFKGERGALTERIGQLFSPEAAAQVPLLAQTPRQHAPAETAYAKR
jgi:hypothetical protein